MTLEIELENRVTLVTKISVKVLLELIPQIGLNMFCDGLRYVSRL